MDEANTQQGTFCVSGKTLDMDFRGQHIVTVTDRSGHSLNFQLFQGVHYTPMFKVDQLQQIRGFNMRLDDIYFAGYPRTGTNWTFEMASMLLNGKAETIQRAKDLMELSSHDELAQLPSPRIVNSHMKLSDSPDDVAVLKCKVIYTLRDPKDVAVSLYKLYYDKPVSFGRYMGSFEDYLYLFLDGTVDSNGIFEHLRDAEKYFGHHPEIPVHIQSYEEAIKESKSPDLTLIEHFLDALDRRLQARQQQPQNLRQLAQTLHAELVNIHQSTARHLIASMG